MRTARMVAAMAVLGGALLASDGCGHRGAAARGAAPVLESRTGIVSIVGTAFEARIALRTGNTVTTLVATAIDSAALSRVGGAEVEVRGGPDGSAFRVAGFVVRRVDGAPVADGVIALDGGRLVLQTASGHAELGNPPAAFRSMVGARVWVGGSLERGPNNYGVIVPRP